MSSWYFEVNEYCLHISECYELPLIKVAGIMSALSPNNKFNQNCKDTERFIQSGGFTLASTYKAQRDKAFNILHAPVYNEEIIKDFLGKEAFKTKAFFENIYRPHNSTAVTVDLWMIRMAKKVGLMPLKGVLTPKRYRTIAAHIRAFAEKRNILPHEYQAILWEQLRGGKY